MALLAQKLRAIESGAFGCAGLLRNVADSVSAEAAFNLAITHWNQEESGANHNSAIELFVFAGSRGHLASCYYIVEMYKVRRSLIRRNNYWDHHTAVHQLASVRAPNGSHATAASEICAFLDEYFLANYPLTFPSQLTVSQTESQYEGAIMKVAYPLYLRAARADHAGAMFELGRMYEGDLQADHLVVTRSYGEALRMYKKAAAQGNVGAASNLGRMYSTGCGVTKDFALARSYFARALDGGELNVVFDLGYCAESLELYRRAAERGHVGAQFEIGKRYDQGICVAQDISQAAHFYYQAAEGGSSSALNNVGCIFGNANSSFRDYVLALEAFKDAADGGDEYAMFNLGYMYEAGLGVERSDFTAFEMYGRAECAEVERAASRLISKRRGMAVDQIEAFTIFGTANKIERMAAWAELAHMYLNGTGVKLNADRAFFLYQRAAKGGNIDAMYALGGLYVAGLTDVGRDYQRAIHFYELAAGRGHSQALFECGNMYEEGVGVSQNLEKAVEFYKQAVTGGSSSASNNLGRMYRNGDGTAPNAILARECFQRAVDGGDMRALFNLGYMHEVGLGIERDFGKAFELYTRAEKADLNQATSRLGYLYWKGLGVSRDVTRAAECITSAANNGDNFALCKLGEMYYKGQGVRRNMILAYRCLHTAVELEQQGVTDAAFYYLGLILYYGRGAERDLERSARYFNEAAGSGHVKAARKLKKMRREMRRETFGKRSRKFRFGLFCLTRCQAHL